MVGPLCLMTLTACETAGEVPVLAGQAANAATGTGAPNIACTVEATGTNLPEAVRETSGLASSARGSDLFWTHNDAGNEAELFAIDGSGGLSQRVQVNGAMATDWEDIEAGPCESGNCLYIGDIGDNDGEREQITIYRVPEPASGASATEPAVALHARYPDGPRDAESLFRLPSGDLYVVTKGRSEPIAVYRYPAPDRPGETVTLEPVRQLFPEAAADDDRVTGASATPDGEWVAIRSYRNLYLYRADELVGAGTAEPAVVDLRPVGHGQGEAVVLASDGQVWLTSEAPNKDSSPLWGRMRCELPEEQF